MVGLLFPRRLRPHRLRPPLPPTAASSLLRASGRLAMLRLASELLFASSSSPAFLLPAGAAAAAILHRHWYLLRSPSLLSSSAPLPLAPYILSSLRTPLCLLLLSGVYSSPSPTWPFFAAIGVLSPPRSSPLLLRLPLRSLLAPYASRGPSLPSAPRTLAVRPAPTAFPFPLLEPRASASSSLLSSSLLPPTPLLPRWPDGRSELQIWSAPSCVLDEVTIVVFGANLALLLPQTILNWRIFADSHENLDGSRVLI